MRWAQRLIPALCLMGVAGLCHGADRIEIVLDTSMGMWDSFPAGMPKIVAARAAIEAFIASPAVRDLKLEIGLRTIGGRSEVTEGWGCGESESVIDNGPVDPTLWFSVLADVDPRGGRALVHAVEEAAEYLSGKPDGRRIVVITAGADQCHRDFGGLLDALSKGDNPISVRIIGLNIGQELANSFILSAPTRNVSKTAALHDTMRWAMLPAGVGSTRPEWLELDMTRGDLPIEGAILHMVDPLDGEETTTTVDNGVARIRIPPGRYRATIEESNHGPTELAGITHLGNQESLDVVLSNATEVTLEVVPERPLAGDEAHIQYWGAPAGRNWAAVTIPGMSADEYLVRSSAPGPAGEVSLRLPDSPNRLEVNFSQEIGSGVHQVLGRIAFESRRRRISIEAQERVENRTPLTVEWRGTELPGDSITIAAPGNDIADSLLCLPTFGGGPAIVDAPTLPGDYVIRYITQQGQTLARTNIEVFEVLATLAGPTEIAPGDDVIVNWTGPDAQQDYLSIAAVGANDDQYLSFSPTTSGSPAHLTAPRIPGNYELRYVRAADGEVLARQPLTVAAARITLDVPPVVEAGTRFEVTWSGTAAEGDFIAVARRRSALDEHLDWSYTNLGRTVTLAAPFEAGRFVVRYISGATRKIVARALIEVR